MVRACGVQVCSLCMYLGGWKTTCYIARSPPCSLSLTGSLTEAGTWCLARLAGHSSVSALHHWGAMLRHPAFTCSRDQNSGPNGCAASTSHTDPSPLDVILKDHVSAEASTSF